MTGVTPLKFDSLGLKAELLRAIGEQHYDSPTPIQSKAIPAILAGDDLLAAAQTGTGKTAAFTLPVVQQLMVKSPGRYRAVRSLVLVPTRELALQVSDSVRTYGKYASLSSAPIFGGVSMSNQIKALRRGCDIVIATPGRLHGGLTGKGRITAPGKRWSQLRVAAWPRR